MFIQLRAKVAYANGEENVVQHVFDVQGGTIGRDPHCQMVLQDPFRRISRIQAQIVFDGAEFALINASTSNPIYVDGHELNPGATCVVQAGSIWQTGNYTIIVEHLEATVEAGTSAIHILSHTPAPDPTLVEMLLVTDTDKGGPFADLLATQLAQPHPPIGQSNPWDQQAAASGRALVQNLTEQNSAASSVEIPDPFARKSASSTEGPNMSPKVQAHGADPFADLLATPISHQVAAAPAYTQQGAKSQTSSHIPDDFNPLTLQGVSPRNSADPLGQVQSAQSFQEMFPERSMDAIFQPNEGRISELTQDPLNAIQHQGLVDTSSQLDPLELFSRQSSENQLNPATLFLQPSTKTSTVADNRVEVGAYFRAPRAYEPIAHPSNEAPPAPNLDATLSAPIADRKTALLLPQVETTNNSLESLFDISSSPVSLDLLALDTVVTPNQALPGTSVLGVAHDMIDGDSISARGTNDHALVQNPAQAAEHNYITNRALPTTGGIAASDAHPSTGSQQPTAAPSIEAPLLNTQLHHPSGSEAPQQGTQFHSAQELLSSFKNGAGLNDCRYPENLTPELMHVIGSMLAASTQGCMDLLGSRAMTKQEVRVSVTLINAEANNPLKFLPSGASALAQIFGPRMPGFQAGPAAITSAFQDLRDHEMAMMAGTQAAMSGLFERFSPQHLEEQLQGRGRSKTLFSSQRQARLWEMYCSHYEWLRDEMKNQSPTAWGTEFLSAYQAEVSKNNEGNTK